MITLIGMVSAQVSISPNHLNINAYPGETHSYNFSVSIDGNHTLLFNSSNQFITIFPKELIVNGTENIILNITFSQNTPLGEISFYINTLTDIEQTEQIEDNGGGSSSHHSSGGSGCLTTWECSEWGTCINGNQTRDCSKVKSYCYAPKKDKPIEFQECVVQEDSEDEEEPIQLEGEEKVRPIWIYVLCGVLILAIIFMWYRIVKKERKKKKEKNKNE